MITINGIRCNQHTVIVIPGIGKFYLVKCNMKGEKETVLLEAFKDKAEAELLASSLRSAREGSKYRIENKRLVPLEVASK